MWWNRDIFYDIPDRICVLNKTEDVNLNVFDIVTGTNEANTFLT